MKTETTYSVKEKEVIMTQQLFLISDVSRQLNVPQHRIAYLFMTRKLPEPSLRLGNRRVFTLTDVQRVARALGKEAK
jgi:DNA-binding transcriptional MerR regulator